MDMKSISQKLQDDIRAIMEATLHPNQQKIDVHEPEKDKITAHDFKKLRAMKKDSNGKITKEDTDNQIQELSGMAAQQAAVAISLIKAGKKDGKMPKPMKETAELEETKGAPKGHHFTKGGQLKVGDADQDGHGGPMLRTDPKDKMRNKIPPVTEEDKKVVSPFDYKNYTSQIPKKPGQLTGHDSKKTSAGTVYTKKPVKEDIELEENTFKYHMAKAIAAAKMGDAKKKANHLANATTAKHAFKAADYNDSENKKLLDTHRKLIMDVNEEVEHEEYTFADYLDAARAQYVDEDAVLVANEAFKNKDITLFSDHSQSPEA